MTAGDPARVGGGQHHAGRLDRDVGAGADRDADVGAGERRRVVDPVADHRDAVVRGACRSATVRSLSAGSTSAKTSSTPGRKPRSAATASATGPGVAGDHRDLPDALPAQLGDRLRAPRAGPRPRARARRATALSPATAPGAAPRRRAAAHSAGAARSAGTDIQLAQQRRARRRRTSVPSTVACTPRPVSDRKSRGRGRPRRRRPRTIALASGCSLSASTAAASAQHLVLGAAGAATPVTVCAPLVSVPVLSNSTASTVRIRSSASRSLTRMPARADTAVDSAITSGIARPRACGQAMTSTVTVRTTASSRSPSAAPDDERDQRRRRWRCRTATRRTGRRAPGPGRWTPAPARRGAGCRPARCRRRPPSTRTRIAESVATVPATTRSPTVAGDRPGLAGDHRLVQLRGAVDDPAVGGHPGAGADQHDVADPQVGDRDRLDRRRRVDPLGVVGQQRRERGQRALGLADRLHLLPVAEQHDRDQRGQLPPEVEVEQRRGVVASEADVRDRDRHRDQQHHAGRAVAHLADAADQERPAAVEEHDRAEHRTDPGRCRGSPASSRTSP